MRATRGRLALAAISRGALSEQPGGQAARLLDSVVVDGRLLRPAAGNAVLLNPPYGRVRESPERG